MVPVARRNLFAEKGRFAISVSGVAFAVLLILIVLALYRGWSRTGATFRELPGQLWVVQEGTRDPFHSVSLIETSDLVPLAGVPGIEAVVPVLSRTTAFDVEGSEQSATLMALGIPDELALDQKQREKFLPPRGEIIIEATLSRKSGLGEGDVVTLGSVPLRVGSVRPRSAEVLTPFAFINFQDAREIFGGATTVNYGMVVLQEGTELAPVREALLARYLRGAVLSSEEFAESIRKEIDESFIPVIVVLVAIGFVVGAAVVGLTIYTATIERTREFGVMKAVGGSPFFLYRVVLSQSAMLTAGGFAVGLLAAFVVARLAERAVPEFVTEFQLRDVAVVFAASGVMSVLAAFLPVRRVNSIDPAIVFRA